jgi:hypothetical protein
MSAGFSDRLRVRSKASGRQKLSQLGLRSLAVSADEAAVAAGDGKWMDEHPPSEEYA